MTIDTNWLVTILLIATRLASLLVLTPLTPLSSAPTKVRVLLILSMSIIISFSLPLAQYHQNEEIIFAILSEIINGLILSLSISAVFTSLTLAGQLIDSQMGLQAATLFNPQAKSQQPLIAYFYQLIALAIFFSSGCHRLLFKALSQSFIQLPPGNLLLSTGLTPALTQFSQMYLFGLMIASPVVFSLLLLDIGSGLVTRNMPQISVYFITMPIKILLGIALVYMSLNLFEPVLQNLFASLFSNLRGTLA